MQLSDIRTNVRDRVGISSTDALAADAQLTNLVNASYRQIALERDWDWLRSSETIAVSEDDDEYAVAADWRTTLFVGRQVDSNFADGYAEMERVSLATIRHYNTFKSVPTMWHIEAGTLRVAPVPSQSETLLHYYIQSITALSADGDEPLMPDDYIDYLIVRASQRLATRLKDTELLGLLRDEEREIQRAIEDEVVRSRGSQVVHYRLDTSWGG